MTTKYEKMFEQALKAGGERDYSKAVILLNKIIVETDSIPETFLYLGRSYHALKEFDNAVKMLKMYISYENNSPKGYFFLGRTYLALNLPHKSARYFTKALELNPENPEILGLLGVTLIKLKKINPAVSILEQALEIQPENRSIYNAYMNALYAKGIKEFYYGDQWLSKQILEFLKSSGRAHVNIDLYLAIIEKDSGNFEKALGLYRNVIKENPSDDMLKVQIIPLLIKTGAQNEAAGLLAELTEKNIPVNISNLSSTEINRILSIEYFNRNKFREALLYAKKVIYENYYDNEMHMLMGEIFRQLGQNKKAENHFNLVLKRNHYKIEARYGKILIFWKSERYEELLNEINIIQKKYPDDEIARYYKALTVCKLDLPEDTTIPLIIDEIKINSSDPFLFNALGNEYLKTGKADFAEKWYHYALKYSELKESYTGLIKSLYQQNKKGKINPIFKKYLKIYPDDSRMRKYYIHNLYNEKKFNSAIKEIDKYSMYSEKDGILIRLLAKCYMNTDKTEKAIILYRKMLSENPDKINYLMSYSFCLEKLDRRKSAIDILEKSLFYFRKNNRILLTLGVLYFKEKNYEKALDKFRKVLENDNREWRSYYNISRIYEQQGLKDMSVKFMKHAERYKNA